MATQPNTFSTYKLVSAAGTTVVSDTGVNLNKILVGGTFVGSVEFYDATTAAGTAASNLLYSIPIPATKTNTNYELGVRTRNGLVVVATGTPTLTYTLD